MQKSIIEKGSVFERYEKKYLLNQDNYYSLMARLPEYMQADEYGRHTICTVYYDTEDFAVIRRCLEKPAFRQKLRLRSYGVPQQNSTVYLELKKKMAGITYKRRIALPYKEAIDYMTHDWPPVSGGQIFEEVDWYKSQHTLVPKAVICYDRIAFVGKENPALRLTLDANIRWRDYALHLDGGDHGTLLLDGGRRLAEIKTAGAFPCWLATLLSQLRLYPTAYSKYGSVYSEYLAGKELMRHAG